MVILLDGTSTIGRTAIAEKIVELLPGWRHLSMDVMQAGIPEDEEDYLEQHTEIVRRCAEELQKDGLHMILSMPESPKQLAQLREGLAPHCVAIHIGEGDEETYDFSFDSSVSSVKDIVTFLQQFIERLPDAA